MTFKEAVRADVYDVFLNLSEFADTHKLNGKEIRAIVDDDVLDGEISVKFGGTTKRASGIYNGGIELYVAKSDLGKPKPGSILELDGRRYIVEAASEQDGIYKITINRTGGL